MSDTSEHLWARFSDLRVISQTRLGQVYAGRNYQGDDVTVAVLAGSAATDHGIRAAFADVVWRHSAGPGPGQAVVYAADLHSVPPWAAVRGPADAPGADQLLAELEQPSPDEPTEFTPPVAFPGISPTPTLPVGPARRPGSGAVLVAVALGLVGLLGVATVAVMVSRTGTEVEAGGSTFQPGVAGQPGGERTIRPRSASPTVPAESVDTGPIHPTTGPDGPAGPVKGPTYGDEEDTYLMEFSQLDGFGFDFRTPPGWSCMRSPNPNRGTERQVCAYDGGTFPLVEGGPGGIFEVAPCPAPCDDSQRETLRTLFPDPEAPWQEIDPETWFAQTPPIDTDEGPKVGVYLSRVYPQRPGDAVDTHLTVRMRGHPDELAVLQKIINEIHAVTSP